jgi:hypothetical protein
VTVSIPLTAYQRDIWVAHELFPSTPQFTIHLSQRFLGEIDHELLLTAVRHTVRANDAFRLRFAEQDGIPCQRTDGSPPDVEVLDFSGDADPETSSLPGRPDVACSVLRPGGTYPGAPSGSRRRCAPTEQPR